MALAVLDNVLVGDTTSLATEKCWPIQTIRVSPFVLPMLLYAQLRLLQRFVGGQACQWLAQCVQHGSDMDWPLVVGMVAVVVVVLAVVVLTVLGRPLVHLVVRRLASVGKQDLERMVLLAVGCKLMPWMMMLC